MPVTYKSMSNKDIDVFLGNWMPTMEADRKPYLEDKTVALLETPNLEGAKYTLAVPTYTFDAGLKGFADIAKFKDQLDGKIYGIEPGNDGNRLILDMIKNNTFGLGGFELVESSEQGMLAQVERAVKREPADRLPRLGAAPDEQQIRHEVSLRRRRRASDPTMAAPRSTPTSAPTISPTARTSAPSSRT